MGFRCIAVPAVGKVVRGAGHAEEELVAETIVFHVADGILPNVSQIAEDEPDGIIYVAFPGGRAPMVMSMALERMSSSGRRRMPW